MRIDRIYVQDYPPIKSLDIQISSDVVIIAGANGSGKTRIKEAIVYSYQKPHEALLSFSLKATRQEEEIAWKAKSIQVTVGQDSPILREYQTSQTGTRSYVGTLVQVESNRAVRSIEFEGIPLTTTTPDPDEQGFDSSWHLGTLANRWNKLQNDILKKSAIRDLRIAEFVKEHRTNRDSDPLEVYPDIFLPYQELFAKLLPGKTLEPINLRSPQELHYRVADSQPLPFGTLSAGEKEVVTLAFALVYKQISHSVILIDEPELHLHPSLIFRLVETLRSFWNGTNQLILFTHSADLISTYYSTGNVFIIDPSSKEANQAHQLSKLDNTHSTIARATSANLGIFSVGKHLVFVDGREASIDRLIFHKVALSVLPNSNIIPIGSVENINALRAVVDELTKSIFGINLFLIRDRDGLSNKAIASLESNIHFRCLPRPHIENYLLDPDVLSEVAADFNLSEKQKDAAQIRKTLLTIASESIIQGIMWNVREHIRLFSTLPQPRMPGEQQLSRDHLVQSISGQITKAIEEQSQELDSTKIHQIVNEEHTKFQAALLSDDWINLLPGKIIFKRFCGDFFRVDATEIKEAYAAKAMRIKPDVFQDIIEIFQTFSRIATQ